MDLFSRSNLKTDPAKVKQVKTWITEILNLDKQVTISLNQLTCHEPGCPPIETAIVIMKQSPKQYKIHKSIAEIQQLDIYQLKAKYQTLIKMSKHTIFVCRSCAFSPQRKDYLGQRGGKHLSNQLKALQANWQYKDEFIIQEVNCLSACNRPCVVAFAAPNKTTLMFGDLPPMTSPSSILRFAEQYFASNDGLIKRQDRPEVLQKGILARIPPLPPLKIVT